MQDNFLNCRHCEYCKRSEAGRGNPDMNIAKTWITALATQACDDDSLKNRPSQ